MAAVTLLFRTKKASIGSVELDASISESHSGDVDVTDHPVESGAAISDHARAQPEKLTLEGIISNTPIAPFDEGAPPDQTRAGQAYADLLVLKDAGELISVVTALRTYEDMVLVSLNVPRDAATGNVLRFSASFKQVRVVNSQTVQITTAEDKTKAKKRLDKQTPPETPAPTQSKSFLKTLGGS